MGFGKISQAGSGCLRDCALDHGQAREEAQKAATGAGDSGEGGGGVLEALVSFFLPDHLA